MPNIYRANYSESTNRGEHNPPHKKGNKHDFKTIKKNTINSLNDVECFLNNFGNFIKYIKLYKLLK